MTDDKTDLNVKETADTTDNAHPVEPSAAPVRRRPDINDVIATMPEFTAEQVRAKRSLERSALEALTTSCGLGGIGGAIAAMNLGHCVRRAGWNGKGMFVFLVPGSRFEVTREPLLGIFRPGTEVSYLPHVDMKTATGDIVPWLCSQTDLLAEDWELAV